MCEAASVIEDFRVLEHAAEHGVGVGAVGGKCLVRADQQVHGEDEPFGNGAADRVALAGWFLAGAEYDHEVEVAVFVFFAAGAAAEEDDLLGLEALDYELGDGLDGVPVERVFDDAHWYLQRHSGWGVAGCEGVHVGKDKSFGAEVAELGLVLALDDGEGGEDVGVGVSGEAVEVEGVGVEAGAEVAAEALEFGDGEGFEVGAGL